MNFGVDESARTIKIVDQCDRYTAADFLTRLTITNLQNPTVVRTSESFRIEIQDKNSRGIAFVDSEIFYRPEKGIIDGISLKSLNGVAIEASVNLLLDFTPRHAVTGASYILMELPSQVEFICDLAQTTGMRKAPGCSVTAPNVIRLDNPFVDDIYAGALPLSV